MSSALQRVAAARELLARRKSRTSLIDFTTYTNERYRTADHHRVVAKALERVALGEIDRLMLLLPPRHGKSELASRRFPAFVLWLGEPSAEQRLPCFRGCSCPLFV